MAVLTDAEPLRGAAAVALPGRLFGDGPFSSGLTTVNKSRS
jgi:hypothetical protein